MKIYILGAGAMGTLYGTQLVKKGHDVVFLDGWNTLIDNMKNKPFAQVKYSEENIEDIPVNVMSYDEVPPIPGDFIFVTVKSSMTQEVFEKISKRGIIGEKTLIMTFQGGFENPNTIASFLEKKENCLPAYTCSYCKSTGIMKIENFKIQKSTVWPFGKSMEDKPEEYLTKTLNELNDAGMNIELSCSSVTDRWKLLIYYPTNIAVSAIVGINFGNCWNSPECQELLINLSKEAALIAKLDGIDQKLFNEEIAIETVKDLAISSPSHAGSMLQDLRNKRITEIDGTNGALLRRAEYHKVDIPYTKTIWALVRTIEKNFDKLV